LRRREQPSTKAEAVRLQNAADQKLKVINCKIQELARKQLSWQQKSKEAQTHKHCLAYVPALPQQHEAARQDGIQRNSRSIQTRERLENSLPQLH